MSQILYNLIGEGSILLSIMRCFHLLTILSILTGVMSSCVSSKKYNSQIESRDYTIKRLKMDSLGLSRKIDSLTKVVNDKNSTLISTQNILKQLAIEKEKKTASRKKVDNEHYDKVSLYVYNITKYVEWHPSHGEQSFIIGVVGNDEIYNEMLEQFSGKKISDKPVVVVKMNSLKELSGANLYFVSTSKLNYLSEIYKRMTKNHALVISDIHYNTDGVHINFFTDGDTLKFEMNDDQIKKSKLTLSSSLKHLQHK